MTTRSDVVSLTKTLLLPMKPRWNLRRMILPLLQLKYDKRFLMVLLTRAEDMNIGFYLLYYVLPTRYVYASTSYPPLHMYPTGMSMYILYIRSIFVSLMAISGPPFVGHVVAPTIPRALLASLLLLLLLMMVGHLHGGENGMCLGWALAICYKYYG